MKILMLRNAARNLGCELAEGESGTVEPSLGNFLVSLGIAVETGNHKPSDQKQKKIKGVPSAPPVAETNKPEILADDLDL